MLKYCLRENLLTPAPDDYMAQMTDVRSYTLDEIIDAMMEKGTTITRADVAATLQVYGEVCSSIIADGSAINTPLMNTSMSISGVFNGANDSFDKKRHTVNLNLTAGTLLRIFFVPETGTPVRAAVIAENKPARLMAIIPADLAQGTYYIEVRTKLSGGGTKLKAAKKGSFAKPLTVTP